MNKKLAQALAVIFISLIFPYLGGIGVDSIDVKLVSVPVHSLMETAGAVMAFILALTIFQMYSTEKRFSHFHWSSVALIGMGMLDLFHAMMVPGELFVWLHSLAVLVGGILFLSVWFPEKTVSQWTYYIIPIGAAVLSMVASIVSIAVPGWVPRMLVDGEFSDFSIWMNDIGGIAFMFAGATFLLRFYRHGKMDDLLFSGHTFLFGISGVLFATSSLFSPSWWLWHLLRLIAYCIALFYTHVLFIREKKELERAKVELSSINENLEYTVQDRTKEMQDREQRLRLIFENAAEGIMVLNAKGVIQQANRTLAHAFLCSSIDLVGKHYSVLFAEPCLDDLDSKLRSHNTAATRVTIVRRKECLAEHSDGSVFPVEITMSAFRNEEKDWIVTGILNEISERKRAQEATEEARRAAELSNRAKSEFMANMSHELRTPLNAIIGFSETIKDQHLGPQDNDKYAEYVEHIHYSGAHLLELINDILDVSAIEAGKLELHDEELDVPQVCRAAIRILGPKAQEVGVSLEAVPNAAVPYLFADERRMKQIFLNLISNAVKFTPSGGQVSCDAYVDDQGRMIVTVADNGIGMDEQGIQKALSKFGQVDSRIDRKYEGSGLGLPLTMGLVECHGGVMELTSTPGRGTKVTLTFPAERVVTK